MGRKQYTSNEILNESMWEMRSAKKQDETASPGTENGPDHFK